MLALKQDTDRFTQWIPHQKSGPSLNDVNDWLSAIVEITSAFLHLFLLLYTLIVALCNSSFLHPAPVVVDFTAFSHYIYKIYNSPPFFSHNACPSCSLDHRRLFLKWKITNRFFYIYYFKKNLIKVFKTIKFFFQLFLTKWQLAHVLPLLHCLAWATNIVTHIVLFHVW